MGLLATPALRLVSGRAEFGGQDLFALSPRALSDIRGSDIAMIFQEPMSSLNPALTIGEQIAESVRRHRGLDRRAAMECALDMLRRVRIPAPEQRLSEYPYQLSGGMRQRAMIAMALANDPKLLIADEPTTALDVTVQQQVLDLMKRLQRETGTGLIMITHDLGVVAEMADLVAVMYAGRIVESGPVAAIFNDPQHPYTIGLMSSMPSLNARGGRLVTIPGVVPPADAMPGGCRFAARCPFAGPVCATPPPLAGVATGHSVACWAAPLEQTGGRAMARAS
jgi:oligopeptide/dipeptide ABC transporter ATP-binding protein